MEPGRSSRSSGKGEQYCCRSSEGAVETMGIASSTADEALTEQ